MPGFHRVWEYLTMKSLSGIVALAALAGAGIWGAAPVQALTMQECSAKYSAAKAGGTLGDQSWNDFRKDRCGAGDAAAKPAAAPTMVAQAKSEPKAEAKSDTKSDDKAERSKRKSAKSEKDDAKPSGPAVFPTAISPKHAKEKESKQRQLTCLDQYRANKAANANGGLKWIQKGGGYYSECNKKLKG